MTKINREEYEVLKELVDKYKWISRDGNNISELIKEYEYHNEPVKLAGGLSITQAKYDKYLEEHIKELENEREETEVKDIEWLKKEFDDLFNGKTILTVGRSVVDEILNQLDESEVKRLEKKIKELDSFNDELIRDNNQLRNELDNQEVLSEEWIDENKKYNNVHDIGYYIPVEKLQKLLVSKQEVTIDKEDAENIVQYKEMGWTLSHLINDYGEDARHDELLAKAWLAYPNIEVEEEQKYIIKIGNLYLAEPLGDMTSDIIRMTRDKGVAYQFTDEESIATHLDKFEGTEAVKVEEETKWK